MEGADEDSTALINIRRESRIKNSLLGKRRACNTVTKYEWTFLAFVSITLTIILGIVLFRIFDLPTTSSDFTLAILLLINLFFCYLYTWHGVVYEQPYEILFLIISTLIIIVYTSISYHIEDIHDYVKTAKLIYTVFVGPVIIVLGFHIGCNYRISRNLIFRTVGADPFMQMICGKAQLQCVLLFFDIQAIFSCLVLIVHAVNINLLQELLILTIGSIFTFGWTVLGYLTVRFESCACVAIFLALSSLQPSFIVWRLVSAGIHQADSLEISVINVSGGFFLLVHTFLIVNTLQVYKNFGRGLKEKIYGDGGDNPQYGTFHSVDA